MVADNEGFLYPRVNEQFCIDCGNCDTVCPMTSALRQGEPPVAFAAWIQDTVTRKESSSGGVFSALMQQTLQKRGVIIGAAFDSNMVLRHQSAQSDEESHKFRGAKYLQSVIGDTYREAQMFLQQGRHVLFSGTPCQIAGLYGFLGKDDKNLLTCDLVCHGVPSPKVFAKYKTNLEQRHAAKVQSINFRRKDFGWKKYSIAFLFDNATEYRQILTDDPFMTGFLQNVYLRPACHGCYFSRLPRVADISLADFWGVGRHHPEWDDDRGTSLILVQTEKGHQAFDACRETLVSHVADLAVAIRSNPCIQGSVPPGKNRTDFFNDLDRLSFEEMMKKYLSAPAPWLRIIASLNRLFRYGLRRINSCLFQ